jgi:uncharacterized protein YqjF (DUF2071 family)
VEVSRVAEAPGRFLTAQWRDLLMLNFVVDPALLAPHVPAGTTLDRWQGEALVSVVGFRFVDTRVLGMPLPGHRDFEEVNLRFYVRRHAAEGVRRAVVFIRELVPRRAIAWVARAWYNEPYRALPMRHSVSRHASERTVRYEWREGRTWTGLAARSAETSPRRTARHSRPHWPRRRARRSSRTDRPSRCSARDACHWHSSRSVLRLHDRSGL